jgi:hypothetical protein
MKKALKAKALMKATASTPITINKLTKKLTTTLRNQNNKNSQNSQNSNRTQQNPRRTLWLSLNTPKRC